MIHSLIVTRIVKERKKIDGRIHDVVSKAGKHNRSSSCCCRDLVLCLFERTSCTTGSKPQTSAQQC